MKTAVSYKLYTDESIGELPSLFVGTLKTLTYDYKEIEDRSVHVTANDVSGQLRAGSALAYYTHQRLPNLPPWLLNIQNFPASF